MKRSILFPAIILTSLAALPLRASAKDCVASVGLSVIRANGTTEYPAAITSPPTIVLGPGDVVSLRFWSNGISECGANSRYVLSRNGVQVMNEPVALWGGEVVHTVTEPGFYGSGLIDDSPMGIGLLAPPPSFFVATSSTAPVVLDAKAWLDGPYVQSAGLMSDQLRAGGLLPPTHSGSTIAASVLAVTGPNAIVDRVSVSLRPSFSNTTSVGGQWALIQRDGDIVALDGVSPLSFAVPPGSYYVVLRHRNHLGVMTAAPVALSATATTVDFRSPALATYGTDARKTLGDQRLLWCGRTGTLSESPRRITYTGPTNDRDPILVRVGGSIPTSTVTGYYEEDVNMDGMVKYTGTNNDRDRVLSSIGGGVPTAVRMEQIP